MEDTAINKRQRTSDESVDTGVDVSSRSLQQQFMGYDTDALAAAGRHDGVLLEELQLFCIKLSESIAAVRQERADEERERLQKEKEIQLKKDKAARIEKTKLRQKLVDEGRCFNCNSTAHAYSECVDFKHDGGVAGNGMILCEECYEKVATHTCASCDGFLHYDVVKISPNIQCCVDSGYCGDDSYKCKNCNEVYCLYCGESEDSLAKCCDDCSDWYCSSCTDTLVTQGCSMCTDKQACYCEKCAVGNELKRCDGECNEPICDDCAQRLDCGNNVRLCGECEFCCEDCDYCDGYC